MSIKSGSKDNKTSYTEIGIARFVKYSALKEISVYLVNGFAVEII